jgi:DNA-binding winged helix-turn-helix (wHTH) protein/tetratricopeptide (TPR) repeat protein
LKLKYLDRGNVSRTEQSGFEGGQSGQNLEALTIDKKEMRKISFNEFTLVPSQRRLLCSERDVTLNPKAFDLLTILAENPGRVISKEEVMEKLWPDSTVEEGNLAVQISNIRTALKRHSAEPVIRTVPGIGYCFAASTSETDEGVPDFRCNHGGGCIGLVIPRIGPDVDLDKTLRSFADCLESASSELDEIHLYSRRPLRGLHNMNGSLFLEVRLRRSDSTGKSEVTIEFTNPATDEVRFRRVVPEQELRNSTCRSDMARVVMDEFAERHIGAWRDAIARVEQSAKGFMENILTQILFLMEIETEDSLGEAGRLIDKAVEMAPGDYRFFLLKAEMLLIKSNSHSLTGLDVRESFNVMLTTASRLGAPSEQLALLNSKLIGAEIGREQDAVDILEKLDRFNSSLPGMNVFKADLLIRLGRRLEAKIRLQTALERNPLSFSALRRLALLNGLDGNWDEACQAAGSLLRFLPNDGTSLGILEQALTEMKFEGTERSNHFATSEKYSAPKPRRVKTRSSGALRPSSSQLLGIATLREAAGDVSGASAYRRMARLTDDESESEMTETVEPLPLGDADPGSRDTADFRST